MYFYFARLRDSTKFEMKEKDSEYLIMRLLIILTALFSVLFPIYAATDSFVIPLSSPVLKK